MPKFKKLFKKPFKKYAKKPANKYVKRTKPYRKKYAKKSGLMAPSTGLAGSLSKTVYHEKHRMTLTKKMISTMTPINYYQFNNAYRFAAPPGRQSANSIQYFIQPDLLPQYNSITSGPNASKQLFIHSLTATTTFANAGSSPVQLILYDVGYKREMDISDVTTFAPELAWNNGEIQEGNALGSAMLGAFPNRIGLFNDYYKIKKVTTKFLGPGAAHTHNLQIEPNKRVSMNRVNGSIRYAGLSHATLVLVKGLPVDTSGTTLFLDASGNPSHTVPQESYYDVSGNPIAPALAGGQIITTSPTAINIASTWRYGFQDRKSVV